MASPRSKNPASLQDTKPRMAHVKLHSPPWSGHPHRCESSINRVAPLEIPIMRILLVDDDASCREAVTMLLEFIGCQIDPAASGQEAIQKYHPARYDAVLTDFQMSGMNGLELAAELKKRYPEAYIILCSAYDGIANHHINASLPKPASINDFREALKLLRTSACAVA